MFELLEKTLLVGMGTLSLSQKKAEELRHELRQRFDVSEEEGKALLDRLQQYATDYQRRATEIAQEEAHKAYERMGVATRDEIEQLRQRIAALEQRLDSLSPH